MTGAATVPTRQEARTVAGPVLVLGASGGIGSAVVRRLAADGVAVVAAGRNLEALTTLARECGEGSGVEGGTVSVLTTDLLDKGIRSRLVAEAVARFGTLGGFVCAAGCVFYEPAIALTEEALRAQFEVNVLAPALVLRDFAQHRRDVGGSGAAVLIASTLAERPAPDTTAYAASKAAVLQLARSFALELAAQRTRVNVVLPGIIDTPMVQAPRPSAAASGFDAALHHASLHPLGRVGSPADVADATHFLLAAPWITGTPLVIDGGLLLRP